MPLYEYQASTNKSCPKCLTGFTELQDLNEPELTKCPHCYNPVVKMISNTARLKSPTTQKFSHTQLARKGFTQYKRTGSGTYEKTFGKGPRNLKA